MIEPSTHFSLVFPFSELWTCWLSFPLQESRTAARKLRDSAAIPVGFHCHVVAFPFPVPMSTMSTFRPSPQRCVVFLVTYMLFEMRQK